jgi:hypothetical protein
MPSKATSLPVRYKFSIGVRGPSHAVLYFFWRVRIPIDRPRGRRGEVFECKRRAKFRIFREVSESRVAALDKIQQRPRDAVLGRLVFFAAPAPGFIAMGFQRTVGERDNNFGCVPSGVRIFERREREICHRRPAIEQFAPPGIHRIVVEGLENPIILALETQLARITRKPRKSSTTSKPSGGDLSWSRNGTADAGSIRVNVFHAPASDTTTDARISARAPSLPFLLDVHFDADGTVAFEKNPSDLMVGQQIPARRADHRACCLRDFTCTPGRIPCSIHK